tara:strand:- start:47175 stop:48359 length:1185 start_codon:yes stop_codon:yes gene_type:complete
MSKEHSNLWKISLIVILIAPIAQFATDIYVPALPDISIYFSQSNSFVQWTITAYLISFALGQPIAGILADKIGRKPTLAMGLSIFIIGCVGVFFVKSIDGFYFFRFIQGLGLTSTAVMMKVIASDCFTGKDLIKLMTYAITVYGIGPIVAPALGAYISDVYGWKYTFIALIIFASILLLMITFLLPETKKSKEKTTIPKYFSNAKTIFSNSKFTFSYVCGGLCFASSYAFNMIAPFLYQNTLNISLMRYGYIVMLVGASYLVGSLLNRYLIKFFSCDFILLSSVLISSLLSTIFLLATLFIPNIQTATITIFSCGFIMLSGLMLPNYIAKGIDVGPTLNAVAGSLSGTVMMLTTAVSITFLSILPAEHISTVPTAFWVIALLNAVLFVTFIYKK